MAELPKAIRDLIGSLERMPGIGPKSATRLAFFLLNVSDEFSVSLAKSIGEVKSKIKICHLCYNLDEKDPCAICTDKVRKRNLICVVERAIDVIAIEKAGYSGLYHVLGGAVNPLEHVSPQDLRIEELMGRLRGMEGELELILATNPTMEGEATALYIKERVSKLANGRIKIKLSRIGSGLPMGADLEYADLATLSKALEGRREI